LPEGVEAEHQRNGGKCLPAFGFDRDQEIGEIDRNEDSERKQEADQELLAASGIFRPIAVDCGVRPHMPADVGGKPEAVEADGDKLQRGAASRKKSPRSPENATLAGGNGGGNGGCNGSKRIFTGSTSRRRLSQTRP
jgi:hypothetical protein